MTEEKEIICFKDHVRLEPVKTYLTYLGHTFSAEILRCPKCGEVYIPEELVKGRITDVEMQLEDK
jgi:hypothetical protein